MFFVKEHRRPILKGKKMNIVIIISLIFLSIDFILSFLGMCGLYRRRSYQFDDKMWIVFTTNVLTVIVFMILAGELNGK